MNINMSTTLVSWLSIWGPSFLLAISAFLVAYFGVHISHWYLRPRLDFEFEFKRPFFRLVPTTTGGSTYYVRFAVTNKGRTQADDCEAVLEEVWWKADDDARNLDKWIKWTILPVNLKWSGENPARDFKEACFKTIYPGQRRVFCDIGHIKEGSNEFSFELPRRFLEQSEGLLPGKFKIQISVYARNAEKKSRKFKISWSGEWKHTEEEMSKEIIVE